MDDLQARLDRAITEAREVVLCAPDVYEVLRPAVDRLSALVALRARYEERYRIIGGAVPTPDLDAEAERLLGREDA